MIVFKILAEYIFLKFFFSDIQKEIHPPYPPKSEKCLEEIVKVNP